MTDTTIEIKIDGQEKIATASEILHPVHRMFLVTLEDGYSNIFFTDVESGKWIEQDLGFTSLAEAIGSVLPNTNDKRTASRKKLSWHHEYTPNTKMHFGFHHYMIKGYRIYEIYSANRRYMFTLVKLDIGLWQLFRIPNVFEWEYDQGAVEEIAFCIDNYSIANNEN
jgi:hypothetical protein